jgi:hypothetical protein
VSLTRWPKSKALIKSKESQISKDDLLDIAHKLRELPTPEDVIAFLNSNVPTTEADLNAVLAFINAARVMKEVPEYKNRMRSRMAPKHCVRCHGTYTVATNTDKACRIPHAFSNGMMDYGKMASPTEKIYIQHSECCDGVELDSLGNAGEYLNLKEVGYCFEGEHTTQDLTVEFNGGTGDGYNEINIKECVIDPTTNKCSLHPCVENPILVNDADSTMGSDEEGMLCPVYPVCNSDCFAFDILDRKCFLVSTIGGRWKLKETLNFFESVLYTVYHIINA